MNAGLLTVATPIAWLEGAVAQRDVLLIDHANCEKKAASTALALMFAYAEDTMLVQKFSRLAREELRHFEQAAKLMQGLRITPRRLAPSRYAEGLRRLVAKSEPQRELDLMICGAFIEARSCERFAALRPVIGEPVSAFFGGSRRGGATSGSVSDAGAPRGSSGRSRHGCANCGVRGRGGGARQQPRLAVSFPFRCAFLIDRTLVIA